MAYLTFILSLVISINSSLNCSINLQKNIDDTYSNSTSHILLLKDLISNSPSAISSNASITVFTHGMGGNGRDWYTIDTQNGALEDFGGLSLAPLTDAQTILLKNSIVYDPSNPNPNSKVSLKSLYIPPANQDGKIDFSRPLFLVYQGPYDCGLNDYIPNERLCWHFAQALDAFLYNYYLAFGIIPKVNLIGHSRGGLVNMIYAIEHPALIASFMSVGTPYLGSEWAEVLYDFQEAIIANDPNSNIEHTPYYGVIGNNFADSYATAWNDIVDEYGFPTKAVGCGYAQEYFEDVVESILSVIVNHWIDSFSSAGLQFFTGLESTVVQDVASFLVPILIDQAAAEAGIIINNTLNKVAFVARLISFFSQNPAGNWVANAFNQIADVLNNDVIIPLLGSDVVTTDFAVNTNSQIGKSRDGSQVFNFDTEELFFDYNDFFASEASRPEGWPVLHNYEAKSPLVKAQFSSLLQTNPSCRHIHSFGVSNSGNTHFFSCGCGATFHTCQGSYSHSYYGPTQHQKTCLLCGYSRLMPHSITYTSYNTSGHSGYCIECGGQIYNASHEFVYSGTLNSHVGMCPCGHSIIEPHTYIGGRCIKCGRRKIGGGL